MSLSVAKLQENLLTDLSWAYRGIALAKAKEAQDGAGASPRCSCRGRAVSRHLICIRDFRVCLLLSILRLVYIIFLFLQAIAYTQAGSNIITILVR